MQNKIQCGETLTLTAPYTRVAGAAALVGRLFGVAVNDVTSGAEGVFDTEGVFDIAKEAPLVIAQGDRLYWDDSAKKLTKTALANTAVGVCVVAALSADTTVRAYISKQIAVGGSPQGAAVADLAAGTNLTALAVTATTVTAASTAGGNTYADTAVNPTFAQIKTALDLKADNADCETLRTEIEVRLDAIEAKILALQNSLQGSGAIAP